MPEQFLNAGPARVGRLAGKQEVQGAAQRVQVGPAVHLTRVTGLFRGQVVGRAEDLAGPRQGGRPRGPAPGQPEVEDLDGAAGQQQVVRLQVAVDEAVFVDV